MPTFAYSAQGPTGLVSGELTAADRAEAFAPRLVRRLCASCREPAEFDAEYLHSIGFPNFRQGTLMKPKGCGRPRDQGPSSSALAMNPAAAPISNDRLKPKHRVMTTFTSTRKLSIMPSFESSGCADQQ